MALVFRRHGGESVVFEGRDGPIRVEVRAREGCKADVFLVIEAPPSVRIMRGELLPNANATKNVPNVNIPPATKA